MHEVLVNRLGGLSLPRKSVVRLTDRPDMTLDVYRGRKTTIQLFSTYTACIIILSLSAIPWSRMSPDGRYNCEKFQFRSCIFYGRSIIDGFRKGDPNIRVSIPDLYSRATEEGREV